MRRIALAFSLLLPATALSARQEEVFEKAFSMEGVSQVSVENVNGGIKAIAWDRPYLKIRAVKTAHGGGSEEILRKTEIRIRKEGERISIETINPRRHRLFGFLDFGGRKARVDYQLHIPASAETHLETCNGRVQAVGFGGALACDAVNGSIELREMDGPVKATTVNGSLRISFRGPLRRSRLETVNGNVEVVFDRNSSVRYDLSTVNGRIEGDIDLAVEGKYGPKEAKGSYNGGAETLRCETINGSIHLRANGRSGGDRRHAVGQRTWD